jgi:general secretion pathway protein J
VRGNRGGFTLVEILVALAIFAIMALAAFRGLSAMLDARAHIERENDKWRGVALFFARLENDLEAALNRPVRGAADLGLPALTGSATILGEDDTQLAFTRNGHAGQEGQLSAPQRVGYRLRGEALEMLAWSALDQAPRSRPEISLGLEGVTQFVLRYLDQTGNWQTQWPPPGQNTGLPAAVEATVTLRSGESIMRMFALP